MSLFTPVARSLRRVRAATMQATALQHQSVVAVLCYHALDGSGCVLSTPPHIFAEQMRILREQDVQVVPLGEIPQVLGASEHSKPVVAITFDDGFQSVYEHALPVLQRYGFPATVFLVTDYCARTNGWPGQPAYIEQRSLLRWHEIRDMSTAGISFGSHTRTHPDLTTLTTHEAEEELAGSKAAIENAVGSSVDTFAYPYGIHDDAIKRLAGSYFRVACSTTLGFVRHDSDVLALERIDMYYLRRLALFRRLFSPPVDVYLKFRRDLRKRRRGLQWSRWLGSQS